MASRTIATGIELFWGQGACWRKRWQRALNFLALDNRKPVLEVPQRHLFRLTLCGLDDFPDEIIAISLGPLAHQPDRHTARMAAHGRVVIIVVRAHPLPHASRIPALTCPGTHYVQRSFLPAPIPSSAQAIRRDLPIPSKPLPRERLLRITAARRPSPGRLSVLLRSVRQTRFPAQTGWNSEGVQRYGVS